MTCPACGAEAEGKFCSSCGASLTAQKCPACDASVAPGARYCPLCGQSVGETRGRNRALPWVIAGATVMALSAAMLVRLTSAPAQNPPAATAGAPDISNLSPRERADRLFNRVMSAVENGDTAQVNFFVPMALQSYQLLGKDLDPDARYHLGLIKFVSRDFRGALAQADSITLAARGHLLANVLRSQIAVVQGNAPARDKAYRDFLSAYDREMGSGRPEYADHQRLLEQVRDSARRATGK
jgi:hypothetical protein